MTTVAALLAWRPDRLREVADALVSRRRALLSLQDAMDAGAVPSAWAGEAATAARDDQRAIRLELNDRVAGVAAAVEAFDTGAEAVARARDLLEDALDRARREGFTVDRATGGAADGRPVSDDQHESADRARVRAEIADQVEQALRAADHADSELAAAVERVAREVDGGAGDLAAAGVLGVRAGRRALLLPPRAGRPGDFAAWFAGLTDEEQLLVIARHPRWVGNVDGIPGWARHRANQNLVDDHRARLEARLAAAPPKPFAVPPGALLAWRAAYGHLEDKLAGLDAIESLLAQPPGGRQLLLLDVTGSHGLKAAVAVGDVDSADHVTVVAPGLGSTVAGSLATYHKRVANLVEQARRFGDVNGDGVRDTFAGVFWMGYEAPQLDETLIDLDRTVLDDGLARAGAEDLAAFYRGLDALRADDPHLTAVGHSYGSLTTGLALQESTGVDEAVFTGSPGLGTSSLGDLDVPEGHAFHLEARDDAVGDVAWFGRDPSLLDGMRHLSTDDHVDAEGETWSEVRGHMSYYVPDSTSQLNIAAVVAGAHDQVVDSPRGPGWHEYAVDGARQGVDGVREGVTDLRDWTVDRVGEARDGVESAAEDTGDWLRDRARDLGAGSYGFPPRATG
jgi:hypothetical protein